MHRIKIHQGKVASLNVEAIVSCYSQSAAVEMLAVACGDGLIPLVVGDVQVAANRDINRDLNEETDKILIEAIGPRWRGGDYQEEQQLASCYSKAMDLEALQCSQCRLYSDQLWPSGLSSQSCHQRCYPAN